MQFLNNVKMCRSVKININAMYLILCYLFPNLQSGSEPNFNNKIITLRASQKLVSYFYKYITNKSLIFCCINLSQNLGFRDS